MDRLGENDKDTDGDGALKANLKWKERGEKKKRRTCGGRKEGKK